MLKIFSKRIFIGLICLVVFILGAFIIFLNTINPNHYKTSITNFIEQTTGYQATIKGNIAIAFFPYLRLELKQIEISNKHVNLAKLPYVAGKLALWPLLSRQIQIDSIVIKKPVMYFNQAQTGASNWTRQATELNTSSPAANHASRSMALLNDFSLKNLKITDGELVITRPNEKLTLNALTLKANNLRLNEKLTFQLSAHAKDHAPTHRLETDLKLDGISEIKLSSLPPKDLLNDLYADAHLTLSQFRYNRLSFAHIATHLIYDKKAVQVDIHPFNAYQGLIKGQLRFVLPDHQIKSQFNFTNIAIGKFLYDLNQTRLIDGKITSQLTLATHGMSHKQKLKHLSGALKLEVADGILNSIDINGIVKAINHLISKKRSLEQYLKLSFSELDNHKLFDKKSTPFKVLTSSATIQEGIASTSDLAITTDTLKIEGKGRLSLPLQQLFFALQIKAENPQGKLKEALTMLDGSLPFIVKGPLAHPQVVPDTRFIVSQLKKAILKDSEKSVKETLKNIKNNLHKLF